MPAQILESPASLPSARMKSARAGNRYASVARKIRYGKQRNDRRIELMRPDVPIRELGVLAGDGRVKKHRRHQRIGACTAWRVLIEAIFKQPFVQIPIERVSTFSALPIELLPDHNIGQGAACSVS